MRPPRIAWALRHASAALAVGLAGAATIWEVGKPQGHIEALDYVPAPREFFDKYMLNLGDQFEGHGKPVLLKGAAREMPAFKLWTDDYLRQKHGRVKLDQVEPEKKETRLPLPKEMRMAEFLDKYMTSEIYSTSATPKALAKEVYMLPPMNCGGHTKQLQQTVTWMSSGSTKSVIHIDGNHNFHCMFAGRKDWILWPPTVEMKQEKYGWVNVEEEQRKGGDTSEFEGAYGSFFGRMNVDDVDVKRFPAWDKLKWWNLTLVEGDCAYIPHGWYHFVQAPPQRSISTHIWFQRSEKFDQKSCDALVEEGYELSDYLLTIGDCSWGYGEERQRTKCKIRSPPLKGRKRGEEL